ncbi:MAG: hypothetical protein L0Y79_08355 [Chlorobi bacterium]|nr:hypothetical protein [Chlorobiota bacterium]MCI0714776.1 hypothetical protein [Chlorobiota bacterium]
MKNRLRFTVSILVFIAVIFSCSSDKSTKNKQNTQTQNRQKDTVQINKDQYRIAEGFTGSKNQIIDLIKGPATFVLTHQGEGKFTARLMYPDGQLVEVLADVTGNYTGKKRIDVPETRAYVLDVHTEGVWSVYRE